MSLESALDEERREILKLLEGSPQPRQLSRGSLGLNSSLAPDALGRTQSPLGATHSPVRSMLDVDRGPPGPRHGSIAGMGVGVTHPSGGPGPAPTHTVRSLLDTEVSPPSTGDAQSANTSPTGVVISEGARVRTASDASAHPPRLTTYQKHRGPPPLTSPELDYQFAMNPSNPSMTLPKRNGRNDGGKSSMLPKSVARVMQAMDRGEGGSRRGREHGRHAGERGVVAPRGSRSRSPSVSGKLNTNSMNLMLGPGKLVSDRGEVVDMTQAYRRLSDAQLAKSGGSLSQLAVRTGDHAGRLDADETSSPTDDMRLHKDYSYGDGDEEAVEEEAVADSSMESQESSGGEWDSDNSKRGRVRDRQEDHRNENGTDNGTTPPTMLGMGQGKGPRKTLSLLAAAEEERQQVSSQYKVQSLLGPPVTVTSPTGERLNPSRNPGVHPTTSFDLGTSTPVTSDTEAEISDIRRAQRMSVSISGITSTPESHRSIRTVVRGEFSQMQQEAEDGKRRVRTYLVATDLSDEAAYALEWTIGTILRDGDTMIAVYAVDEDGGDRKGGERKEGGDGDGGGGTSAQALAIGEGALAVKDQAAIVGSQTSRATQHQSSSTSMTGSGVGLSPLSAVTASASTSTSASPDSRHLTRAEQERMRATEDITQRCVKLLRKTRLQVRVVVEVIHCKSPKHLITEVIDVISPTLAILGSRGRSALKGVLLGSFSNYLVTKSSVPVMVARRRLRKHTKSKRRSSSGGSATSPSSTSSSMLYPSGQPAGNNNNNAAGSMIDLNDDPYDDDDSMMAGDVRLVNNLNTYTSAGQLINRSLASAKID
ncbi:MAG: hypothetical protein M1823_003909 [Watsoniomyces obsoletus]|nr:MAG: hypothetical protein M1823_003909 [Watsoniomyces obsoletus]